MRRRVLLTCLIVAPVVLLLLFYSLLGSLTGVYSYDGDQVGMNGVGYVVRRGDVWFAMQGDLSAGGRLEAIPLDKKYVEIEQGLWITALTLRYPSVGEWHLKAYSSWNFSVIYDLTLGRDSHLGR